MRRGGLLIILVTLAGLAGLSPVARAATAATTATTTASWLQRITVTAANYNGTTYATFRAFQRSGSSAPWVEVFGPWTARVGAHGVASIGAKREGDGKTPSGTYAMGFMFGVQPNPGVHFTYYRAYTYDYWDDDSASARYNEFVNSRVANPGRKPEPLHQVPAYNYAAVIAYNPARTPGLGSAIFLHVGTGGPTAGCVSLPTADLLKVLRWLQPADHPTITIIG